MRITTTDAFIEAMGRVVHFAAVAFEHADIEKEDRDYKLAFLTDFETVAVKFDAGDEHWFDDFLMAVRDPGLANGPTVKQLPDLRDRVGQEQIDVAFAPLFRAGAGSSALDEFVPAMKRLDDDLTAAGITSVGAAVLFGLSGWEYVPYHSVAASRFLRLLGTEPWTLEEPSDRYEQFLGALAILLRESRRAEGPLRDLLDAQSAVWRLMNRGEPGANWPKEEADAFLAWRGPLDSPAA